MKLIQVLLLLTLTAKTACSADRVDIAGFERTNRHPVARQRFEFIALGIAEIEFDRVVGQCSGESDAGLVRAGHKQEPAAADAERAAA